ncbi:MFS general substrate transporter [Flammula alnicola]|nr:MFS general substrate transporter [Flammula alnicola]
MSIVKDEIILVESVVNDKSLDIFSIHEWSARRLVLDPSAAEGEYGPEIASRLKLSKDGKYILWPQPTDDPEDPQNWRNGKKHFQLFIIIMASIVADFDVGIGIPSTFALAKQFHTTTARINDLPASWSVFLIGWGGIFFVMLMRRYGRLATLFWTQLIALGFLVGATFAPNLKIFTAMRCLTAFFGTCPQATGLYTITDMYPSYLQARMISFWTMGVVLAPHLSPFLFGFLIARASWRWAYVAGCLYSLVVLILIILFMEESFYIRYADKPHSKPQRGFVPRLKSLIGITGFRDARKDPSWREVLYAPLKIVWRPHLFLILFFEAILFGFGIGINLTNTVFLQGAPPFGFGLNATVASAIYATPVVAVFVGEILGRYLNDWIMNQSIKRNKGIFVVESRLWACYLGVFLYICGFVLLGIALQDHLNKAAIIFGWLIAQVAVLVTTVSVYAYCNDCFPREQGEISGLLNLFRTLGGFSVAFYQVQWAEKHGALQVLGCEAAIVAGVFFLIVPYLQWKGQSFRVSNSWAICVMVYCNLALSE